MKKIILILSILLILPIVYSLDECHEVGFCYGTYNLTCDHGVTTDGYCPENYGNWDPCKENSYASKCFPCDPDCGLCGEIMVSVPSNAEPGSNIFIDATIYTSQSGFGVALYDSNPNPIAAVICPGSSCACEDDICTAELPNTPIGVPTSDTGGVMYLYGVGTSIFPYTAWGYGVTKPNINIAIGSLQETTYKIITNAYSEFEPGSTSSFQGYTFGSGRSGSVILDITGADSYQGVNKISKLELRLFKEGSEGNYFPADVTTCKINCNGEDCNLIATWLPRDFGGFIGPYGANDALFDYYWDSAICDNKDFKITATAYDAYTLDGNSADTFFTLNNQNAPCIDNCPKVSSNLLNLVVSKIKVWL